MSQALADFLNHEPELATEYRDFLVKEMLKLGYRKLSKKAKA